MVFDYSVTLTDEMARVMPFYVVIIPEHRPQLFEVIIKVRNS